MKCWSEVVSLSEESEGGVSDALVVAIFYLVREDVAIGTCLCLLSCVLARNVLFLSFHRLLP